MRRAGYALIALMLIGCGGTSPSVMPSPLATATATTAASPTANTAATATRGAEVAQIATQQAESMQIATLTASLSATPLPATPTPLALSPTSVPATAEPTRISFPPTPVNPLSVTVLSDGTGDKVNIRAEPDMGSRVIDQVAPGDELPLHDASDTMSNDGQHWLRIERDHGGFAYIRRDLVSAPHPYRPPTPTPVPPPPTPTFAQLSSDYPLADAADFAKRPDYYRGRQFSLIGRIFSVYEQGGVTTFNLSPLVSSGIVIISVRFRGTSTQLQNDVRVRVYGTGAGTVTGTNAFGGVVTQSLIEAVYLGPPYP